MAKGLGACSQPADVQKLIQFNLIQSDFKALFDTII